MNETEPSLLERMVSYIPFGGEWKDSEAFETYIRAAKSLKENAPNLTDEQIANLLDALFKASAQEMHKQRQLRKEAGINW